MGRYLIPALKRLAGSAVTLFLLASLCFLALGLFPGSPLTEDEVPLNAVVKQNLTDYYGLELSGGERYIKFLSQLLHGNFGTSMHFGNQSVTGLIQTKFPVSLGLGGLALIFAVMLSFSWGLLSFYFSKHRDFLFQVMSLGFISVPTLLLGPLLIWFFGFYLDLLPVALLETPQSYILPVLVLAFRPTALLARILKSSLEETFSEDFIRTGRSLGVSESRLIWKWALKNALIPFLSYLGPMAASLVAGSFIVEMMFAIPGLGFEYIQSLVNRDYSMLIGLTVFYGFILILCQFLVDLAIQILDPRVKSL